MSTPVDTSVSEEPEAIQHDHRIAVFAVPDDIELLQNIVTELPGMDHATACQIVHSIPGLVPVALDRHLAARTATAVRELGVFAASIPTADIPDLAHPMVAHRVRVTEDGLQAEDGASHSRSWTADQIAVLSVGVVPSNAPGHHRPASRLAMGSAHRSWNDGVHIKAGLRTEAYVVLKDETIVNLPSDELNYRYLEDRISPTSSANFMTLIRDLKRLATNAWITPSARAYLDHGPVRHFEFDSRSDFERYTQFQMLLCGQFSLHRTSDWTD